MFNLMYEPHEAREDTILFPAFHKLVSQHEYDALGIYDLAQFTPKV